MNITTYRRDVNNAFVGLCDYNKASSTLARKTKTLMKSLFPDCEITVLKGCYCYVSGFVSKENHHVYFSIGDIRFYSSSWQRNILIRTAENTKDYHGGMNHNTDLENLQSQVYKLLAQEHKRSY